MPNVNEVLSTQFSFLPYTKYKDKYNATYTNSLIDKKMSNLINILTVDMDMKYQEDNGKCLQGQLKDWFISLYFTKSWNIYYINIEEIFNLN